MIPENYLQKHAFHRIKHISGQTVTYLQNPKVACTSLELTLWRRHDPEGAPDNPHSTRIRPFIQRGDQLTRPAIDSLLASQFFSVVRNPYARLLSAYLDKVHTRAWQRISASFGLTPDDKPPLNEFLAILKDRDPHLTDHHFRPQHLNLLHGFTPIDFLGFMERIDEVGVFLSRHGFTLGRDGRPTHAASKVGDYLGPGEAAAIRDYYAEDFRIYGYSDDPETSAPVREFTGFNSDRSLLRKFAERRQRAALRSRQAT